MSQQPSSPPSSLFGDVGGTLCPEIYGRKAEPPEASRAQEIRTKCGLARTKCVRGCDLMSHYRVNRPWLMSTFDELTVYWRTTLVLSKKMTSDFLSPSAPLWIKLT